MDPQAVDPAQINHAMAAILPAMFLIGLFITAAIIVPFWVAFKKAGMPGPLALLVLIPGIGFLVTLYVLAFGRWKVAPVQEYAYPPQVPPGGYAPVYPHAVAPGGPPPVGGYNAPGAYTPGQTTYPPPQGPGSQV